MDKKDTKKSVKHIEYVRRESKILAFSNKIFKAEVSSS
jgi:hypothetical protein